MTHNANAGLRSALENLLKRYSTLIAITLFLLGLALRWIATITTGGTLGQIAWQILGDLGVFVAASVAVPFIYERFLKAEDRMLFLQDLEAIIDNRLAKLSGQGNFVRIYEQGRTPEIDKVRFYRGAKVEIIEFGLRLETFSQAFEHKSEKEFKAPIRELLRNGVVFKCAAIDPDSEITRSYSVDRGETDLPDRVRQSLSRLCQISKEFQSQQLKGAIEVYCWNHFPYGYVTLVDPTEPHGRALISHYMYGISRSDTPILEISKASNPELFEKCHAMVKSVLSTAKKLST